MGEPTWKCYVCGGIDYWQRPDGIWVCNKCHPNPNPEERKSDEPEIVAVVLAVSDQPGESHVEPGAPTGVAPSEKISSLEVIALIDRVRKGNDKLFAAWLQIREIQEKEERKRQFLRWDEAKERLHALCKELVARGFKDCLYIENGKKTKTCLSELGEWFCNTCPAVLGGGREYWVEEMEFKG